MGVKRDGLKDWILVRFSAVLMLLYAGTSAFFIFRNWPLNYFGVLHYFKNPWIMLATLAVVVSLCIHAWVGLWTIGTDYIKIPAVRLIYQAVVLLNLGTLFAWTVHLLWRIQ